jgi:enamine deaminase RidA (YjgF/YER057c/UK114 family)
MAHEILDLRSVHPTQGYSHAARSGPWLFVAGQVAKDPDGNLVGAGDFEAQARQVYDNLRAVLEEAGGGLGQIVKMTTYLTNSSHVERWREVRNGYFTDPMPPNTLVIISALADPGFLLEIEATAVLD